MIRWEERLAGCSERAERREVELREAVRRVVRRGELGRSAVDRGSAHVCGRRAAADVAARTAGAVGVDSESFVLGVILRFSVDFGEGHGAAGADAAGGDVAGFVAEDEALDVTISNGSSRSEGSRLTATMLKKPITMHKIPDATSRRQNGMPSDSWLVACLFILPSMLSPMVIIAQPRVTKPCEALSSGQLRAKKLRKSEHSEIMRKSPAIAVIT